METEVILGVEPEETKPPPKKRTSLRESLTNSLRRNAHRWSSSRSKHSGGSSTMERAQSNNNHWKHGLHANTLPATFRGQRSAMMDDLSGLCVTPAAGDATVLIPWVVSTRLGLHRGELTAKSQVRSIHIQYQLQTYSVKAHGLTSHIIPQELFL